MFKLLFLLPLVASLTGTVLAAPISADVPPAARQFRHNKGAAPAGAAVPAGAAAPSGATVPAGATGAGAPAGAAAPASAGAPATAAATNGTPCTNTDQSVASFGGPSPDEGLPQCSSVAVPFECTNSQTIADAFKAPFCNGAPTA
ncbi:hypothetical protein B0H14DRAFT_2733581 [Mycena olivaceomarginata]|nr:hypothetical protein B0H14DRAFT_2733581 [Mycena olivaceomarginata]